MESFPFRRPLGILNVCLNLKGELLQRKLNTLAGNCLLLQWRRMAGNGPLSRFFVGSG